MTWKAIREARLRLEKEKGTLQKDWGGRIPIALIYPNSYFLGMSSLGFQTIYRLLNSYENVVCERFFYDPPRNTTEEMVSIESQRPLADFDVLAFSINFELDYINVISILKACRIPLSAADRDENHPLVIAGGPCVTANPQPLCSFFDCFAIGEGETIVPDLIASLPQILEEKRDVALQMLAKIPGIYVPLFYNGTSVKRQWIPNLNQTPAASTILTPDTELSNMRIIEIARGCGRGCRFCLAGFCYRPFRYRSSQYLITQAKGGLGYGKKIGLLAAAVSDHPEIEELAIELQKTGAELSVSSLRIHPLSSVLLKVLAISGTRNISLAPEAGSERLRKVINKNINEDNILQAVEKASQYGLKQIKLYFMVGLPTETYTDIEEIINISLKIKNRTEKTGGRIALTVTPFVPKAHTPFQRLPMLHEVTLKQRMTSIKNQLTRQGIEVRMDSVSWSAVQATLARGDKEIGQVLAHMSHNTLRAWRSALNEYNISTDHYIYRDYAKDKLLPWSVIDCGVNTTYLEEELSKANNGTITRTCSLEDCTKCGVC